MMAAGIGLPVTDDFGSRAARRRAVVTLYGSFVAGWIAVGAGVRAGTGPAVRIAVVIALIAALFAGAYAFWRLMRRTFVNAPNLPERDLDERQRERTYRALRIGYPVLGSICCMVPLYVLIATTAEQWTFLRNPTWLLGLGWALLLLALTLPTAILAWTEPDPLDDGVA